jgi:hypothetical protein
MPQLALLGGPRVRTRPFPSWPIFGEAEEQRLLRTLRSAQWGRLDGTRSNARTAKQRELRHQKSIPI